MSLVALTAASCAGALAPLAHQGANDASAAAWIGTNLFAAASDEEMVLRLYSAERSGPAVFEVDLTVFLELGAKANEPDIEAAARVGDRVYWIGSHSADERGRSRPDRQRFFATDVRWDQGKAKLEPVGRPYRRLLEDLTQAPALARYDLGQAARRGPEVAGGLNIEGLGAAPGGGLLIGFRNPVPGGKALLVPLTNPAEVVEGGRSRFGEPVELALGGYGIRDMVWTGEGYWILAGSYGGSGRIKLYWWAGDRSAPASVDGVSWKGLKPEALAWAPERSGARLLVTSDDGKRKLDGGRAKELADRSRWLFRSLWVEVEPGRSP